MYRLMVVIMYECHYLCDELPVWQAIQGVQAASEDRCTVVMAHLSGVSPRGSNSVLGSPSSTATRDCLYEINLYV